MAENPAGACISYIYTCLHYNLAVARSLPHSINYILSSMVHIVIIRQRMFPSWYLRVELFRLHDVTSYIVIDCNGFSELPASMTDKIISKRVYEDRARVLPIWCLRQVGLLNSHTGLMA